MLTERNDKPAVDTAHRHSFFRQSGWLMIANISGGMLMWAVHFLAKAIPVSEYGVFGAFLAVVMLLPTIPLQMVLAQQTAKALATGRERELSSLIRLVALGIFLLWLGATIVVLIFQQDLLARWHLSSPVALWLTLPVVLFSLWMPMFWGVLQGQQNFLWLGWSMMINALGRVAIAAVAVLLLHTNAAGMLAGVLLGVIAASAVGAWQTRSLWLAAPQAFDWRSFLNQAVPLLLAFLGFQILFTADTMFVKAYFSENEAGFYVSAGTLSRALMWLVLPLASVMFPRLVHSAARSEKSNLMGMVLLGTGVLAVLGALSLSVLGPFIVKIVYKQSYVEVASSVLPWYAGAMVPLALANVLLNNLLARPASKLGLALAVLTLAIVYLVALTQFHQDLVMVLKTLGVCSLALLGLCSYFTWSGRGR